MNYLPDGSVLSVETLHMLARAMLLTMWNLSIFAGEYHIFVMFVAIIAKLKMLFRIIKLGLTKPHLDPCFRDDLQP